MLITNNTVQDYWFGPLHLPASAVGFSVDDTTATSLYLTDDSVADAINTLAATNPPLITVTGAALPFPRPTGAPAVLHGDGSPEGIVYAGQGSIFLRRDSSVIYQKSTGIHLNTGWISAITFNPKVTVSSLAGGPPANPVDTDIWIATGIDSAASGIRWQFQYDASWAVDAFKWKYIGGGEYNAVGNLGGTQWGALTQIASTGWYYWSNGDLVFTATRQGVYDFRVNTALVYVAATSEMSIAFGSPSAGTAPLGTSSRDTVLNAAQWVAPISTEEHLTLAASETVAPVFFGTAAAGVNAMSMSVAPKRII